MRFLRAFLAALIGMMLPYLALVWFTDPRGDFGTNELPPLVMDAVAEKIPLFKRYASSPEPFGLVLGSSRSMKLRPSELAHVLGPRFFNFAVNNSRAEDDLALYEWIRKTTTGRPTALVIGLDVEALSSEFVDSAETRRRTAGDLDDPTSVVSKVEAVKRAFSTSYLIDTLQSVRLFSSAYARGQSFESLRTSRFEADGYIRYPRWEAERQAGTFNLPTEIDQSLRAYYYRFIDMTGLSPARQAFFETLIQRAHADGARVLVFLTPMHPVSIRYLEGKTRYGELVELTRRYLEWLSRQFKIEVRDDSTLDRIGGSDTGWYDCCHVDESNAALIVAELGRP